MFYLPRRFFKDFVFLADIFAIAPVPAQTAIPTIFHIIDGTYRQHSASSLIDPVGDCWNPSYSNNGPTVEDILWRRCGQGFDYENESAVVALYERLQEDAGAMQ